MVEPATIKANEHDSVLDGPRLSDTVKKLIEHIERDEIMKVKTLSNDLIEEGLITQVPVTIKLAILFYALFKVYQKRHYRKDELKWKAFDSEMRSDLMALADCLYRDDAPETEATLNGVMDDIKTLDSSFGRYIEKVTEKAMVKKGTTLYALGLSLGTAAQLSGASEWEILHFSGKTRTADTDAESRVGLLNRLDYARKVLE